MRSKKTKALLGMFIALFVVLPALGLAAPETAPSIQSAACGWELSKAKVVSAGATAFTPEGTLSKGYVVEAQATPRGIAPVQAGTFRITVTAFSPAGDMVGQEAGKWYVQGNWTIVAKNASAAELKARHSPAVMKGTFWATLDFNPCTTAGAIDGSVNVPMSPGGGKWARGNGSFSGNEKFEGSLALNLSVWESVAAGGEL